MLVSLFFYCKINIEKDEILGIVSAGFEATAASISLDNISSVDGASIRVSAMKGDDFVNETIFNLGSLPTTGIQKLDFISENSSFNPLEIAASDEDTSFTFRRVALEAFPV